MQGVSQRLTYLYISIKYKKNYEKHFQFKNDGGRQAKRGNRLPTILTKKDVLFID